MPKQRYAWSDSKGYTIKIFADTDEVTYNPYEFNTASWSVTYDAQDAYQPGIVNSRFEVIAELGTTPFSAALEQILQDSEGIFIMELWKGLSKEWGGVITPNACTVEVSNGTRFITLTAGDGFYKLDFPSSMYKFTGTKRFTQQIAEIFDRLQLDLVFDGFIVSDTTRTQLETYPYEKDGLYNTGSTHNLFYTRAVDDFRTYREVINDICTCYGMRMYQDRGFLVFQDLTRAYDNTFSFYNFAGTFLFRRAYSSVQTLQVMAGGTKMYLPALKKYDIVHEYSNTQVGLQPALKPVTHYELLNYVGGFPVYIERNGIDFGLQAGDGSSHFDFFDTEMRITLGYSGEYDFDYEIEFRLVLMYGTQSTDGSTWGSDKYMAFNKTGRINTNGSPGFITLSHSLNNYHLPTTPSLGSDGLRMFLEVAFIAGDWTSTGRALMKYDLRIHGTAPEETTWRADNTARIIGEDLQMRTRLGYSPLLTSSDQAIQYPNGDNVTGFVEFFDNSPGQVATVNSLLYITAYRLCQMRGLPQEYYEIDMHGTARLTHYGYWGNTYYLPISLTYTWDTCKATYAKYAAYELKRSDLLTRNPFYGFES
jgi:hypothetical protein